MLSIFTLFYRLLPFSPFPISQQSQNHCVDGACVFVKIQLYKLDLLGKLNVWLQLILCNFFLSNINSLFESR